MLANLGSWGRHPNNIHGQLQRLLGEPEAPIPTTCPVQVKQEKRGATDPTATLTEEMEFPILLPRVIVAYYHRRSGGRSTNCFWAR